MYGRLANEIPSLRHHANHTWPRLASFNNKQTTNTNSTLASTSTNSVRTSTTNRVSLAEVYPRYDYLLLLFVAVL